MTTYNKETGQPVIGFDMGGNYQIFYSIFLMPSNHSKLLSVNIVRRKTCPKKNAKK